MLLSVMGIFSCEMLEIKSDNSDMHVCRIYSLSKGL